MTVLEAAAVVAAAWVWVLAGPVVLVLVLTELPAMAAERLRAAWRRRRSGFEPPPPHGGQ